MRYMLTFYAIENEWMALPQSEREAGIADIGQWFAEHGRAGKIVEGHRLGRGTKTVRLGRVRKKDLAMVSDGPFIEAKESVGSYAVVEVKDEDEAIAIAQRWPAGGVGRGAARRRVTVGLGGASHGPQDLDEIPHRSREE